MNLETSIPICPSKMFPLVEHWHECLRVEGLTLFWLCFSLALRQQISNLYFKLGQCGLNENMSLWQMYLLGLLWVVLFSDWWVGVTLFEDVCNSAWTLRFPKLTSPPCQCVSLYLVAVVSAWNFSIIGPELLVSCHPPHNDNKDSNYRTVSNYMPIKCLFLVLFFWNYILVAISLSSL